VVPPVRRDKRYDEDLRPYRPESSAVDTGGMRGATRVVVLDRQACLEHLRDGGLGRVAITDRALPTVVPVQFELRGSDIVFAADYDSLLARATKGTVVAFQSDDTLPDRIWSVTVVGLASHLTGAQVEAIRQSHDRRDAITLPRWTLAAPDHLIRIEANIVTGQQWDID
jgi:uncharacterized protein